MDWLKGTGHFSRYPRPIGIVLALDPRRGRICRLHDSVLMSTPLSRSEVPVMLRIPLRF